MTSMELKKSHYRHEERLGFNHAGEKKSPDDLRADSGKATGWQNFIQPKLSRTARRSGS
jgi:hypothetical protein